MATDFLKNLKDAVENGDFNSEAAKKIIAIDELADKKNGTPALNQIADDIDSGKIVVKKASEEEALLANAEYEKKLQEIKERDLVLQQIKTLQEIDETVMLSVQDMREFIVTLEESFDKEKPVHSELFAEIEKIKSKYSSIINN